MSSPVRLSSSEEVQAFMEGALGRSEGAPEEDLYIGTQTHALVRVLGVYGSNTDPGMYRPIDRQTDREINIQVSTAGSRVGLGRGRGRTEVVMRERERERGGGGVSRSGRFKQRFQSAELFCSRMFGFTLTQGLRPNKVKPC